MATFIVERIETHIHGVSVEADSKLEAARKAHQGYWDDSMYFEYRDRTDPNDWNVYTEEEAAGQGLTTEEA